jgi:hypothetical protein
VATIEYLNHVYLYSKNINDCAIETYHVYLHLRAADTSQQAQE